MRQDIVEKYGVAGRSLVNGLLGPFVQQVTKPVRNRAQEK